MIYEENLKDKYSYNLKNLFHSFDIQAIPEGLMKILDAGKIEFICISRRSNIIGKVAEICVVFSNEDVYRKIYVLYDYGYCMKLKEIPLKEFETIEGRNVEIKRLNKEEGLTQVFLGRFFKLSQTSISLILKKGRDNKNE